jgi:hypothetical protein
MGSPNFEQGLTKLMVLTELMGLKNVIDGSDEIDDEILADPGFDKDGSEIVVVYHSTPFPCLGRKIFFLFRKNCCL